MLYLDDGLGDAAASMAYYRDHRNKLGEITAVRVTFPGVSDHYPYTFELQDDHGNHLWLSGIAAGYDGDATRAAMNILIESGFETEHAQLVLTHVDIELHRLATMVMNEDDLHLEPLLRLPHETATDLRQRR